MDQRPIELEAGMLRLSITAADMPLDELCGFASRANRKRGFLFVSKVLGKHLPVKPSVMSDACARLAAKIQPEPSPLLVVGLAETATGLGHGVYEHLLGGARATHSLYMHTTRHHFDRPLAFEFREPHSHAPAHQLYWPLCAQHRDLLRQARNLVLVDDELTTGVTLGNLACALREVCPRLSLLQIASLKNWMSPEDEQSLRARVGLPVHCVSLLRGAYSFTPRAGFSPVEPLASTVHSPALDSLIRGNFGRFGAEGALARPSMGQAITADLPPGGRVLVLGTGEFLYPPYLFAEALEQQGFDVRFQSTTRSPILLGGAIGGVCQTIDHAHEGLENYVYNVDRAAYDRIFIGYEVAPLPTGHRLAAQLGAVPLLFDDQGVTLHPDATAR